MKEEQTLKINRVIKQSIESNFRSVFLIVGPNAKYQVPFIHYIWSKNSSKTRSRILWCYKDHKSSPLSELTKIKQKFGNKWKNQINFFNQTNVRFCYHNQTSHILGETFGMSIIQNFETISPNILARVIETVEGGGLIVFLIETVNPVEKLTNISLKLHKKFEKASYKTSAGRFMDILLFSLNECSTFLLLDDQLNLIKNCIERKKEENSKTIKDQEEKKKTEVLLYELIKNLQGMEPLSSLVSKTRTFDQARAFLTFSEALAGKKKISTITLTSPRGRGKSAVLGLASVSAIAYGFGSIFVTAPSPENLNSFFGFLFIGFKTLNYIENIDYEVTQNPKLKYIEKIQIFSTHRQQINFIFPHQIEEKKDQIELLIIDEAAAIPEQDLKKLFGSYVTFISSTNSGYEGSGRSLNLKMVANIKNYHFSDSFSGKNQKPRILKEIVLEEPIRYSKGDPVERWLNDFLCLNPNASPSLINGCPDPKLCKLFLVDRNALFSGHKVAKCFLQKIFGLFATSHYRNSPDDIQLLCDAPSHRILILVSPFSLSVGFLPDILCSLHICYEGQLCKFFVQKNLLRKRDVSGDLIPWIVSKNFIDPSFSELSGVRIIRMATHPDIQNMGYGSRAVQLLQKFSNRKQGIKNLPEFKKKCKKVSNALSSTSAILINLNSKGFLNLDYIGVSFGLSASLFCFWKKNGFNVFFIHSSSKNLKNAQNCIMLKPCLGRTKEVLKWFDIYQKEFIKKFTNLLGCEFRSIPSNLVFKIFENIGLTKRFFYLDKIHIKKFLNSFDINRLLFFAEKNSIGYKAVIDIFPVISKIFFWEYFRKDFFTHPEHLVLICVGLQNKTIEETKKELSLKNFVVISILKKVVIKFLNILSI